MTNFGTPEYKSPGLRITAIIKIADRRNRIYSSSVGFTMVLSDVLFFHFTDGSWLTERNNDQMSDIVTDWRARWNARMQQSENYTRGYSMVMICSPIGRSAEVTDSHKLYVLNGKVLVSRTFCSFVFSFKYFRWSISVSFSL